MDAAFKTIVRSQFGAAVDMLENAVKHCPDALWGDRTKQPEYWYLVYHTLFWLDLYLSGSVEGFTPPAPYGLEELDPAGVLPERPYSKDQMLSYLDHCRTKYRSVIDSLTDERAAERLRFSWGEVSFAERLLYNMRHVQHHAAQLNLILRQQIDSAPKWVAKEGVRS
ncbi:MAG: DinB family protein [Candidatus Eiseniibacteriota bacterium]